MKRLLLSVSAWCMGTFLCGQALSDTVQLKAFEVVAPRIAATLPGAKMMVVDSATLIRYRTTDLGQLLANETPMFVKSYGLGSLATTSFRGGSANHTAVLWNGFNIGSPMNGQLDLSLVPVQVANSVAVAYGSSTALWGSGAIGGTILLNNLPRSNEGTHVDAGLSFGSFGDQRQQFRVQHSSAKWSVGIGAFNTQAENDFRITSEAGDGPAQRQRNASFAQHGLLGDAHYRWGRKYRIGIHAWYQQTDRQIPGSTLEGNSTAGQMDGSLRLTADWQHTGTRATTNARIGWFNDELEYYANDVVQAAVSRSRNVIAELETRIHLAKRHQLHIGVNNTHALALSDGIPREQQQNRSALFAAYRYTSANNRFRSSISARQELLEGDVVPFTCSLGADYALRPWLLLKAQGAKVYRVPTLNDLYWRPGGNPDLRAENGYSGDLGAVLNVSFKGIVIRSEITWFERLIDDWIQWTPGPAYWSPHNLLQVWSRGVETNTSVGFSLGSVGVKLGLMTNHVVSTNEMRTSVNDASVDKQLIYVPMYTGHAKLGVTYKALSVTGLVRYTGYRYTSTDNREYLEPFTLADLWVAYRLPPLKSCTLSLQAQCNNIFATRYEVLLNRPMPFRSYQVGVNVQFHRPERRTP